MENRIDETGTIHRISVGDAVLLRCRVTGVGPGDAVTVVTGPADVPGSEGYAQTITVHHAALLERSE